MTTATESSPQVTRVTPKMLEAGRAAFLRKRDLLDDLYGFFEPDLHALLEDVFTSMARAA